MSNISTADNRYKAAYDYHRRFYAITDSIFNSEKAKQINVLNSKYEVEKNQQKIQLLTSENALTKLSLQEKRAIRVCFCACLFDRNGGYG